MSFFGKSRQTDVSRTPSEATPPARLDVPQPAPPPSPVGFETVLGANSTLEGKLRSGSNVRLDGAFTGTLEISGNVLVGETAKITADINAKNISIAGAVRGNVSGKKVQLLRTGRIWGDIRAQALTTEEGAFIDGKITMIGSDLNATAPSFDEAEAQPEAPAAETAGPAEDSTSTEAEHPVEQSPDAADETPESAELEEARIAAQDASDPDPVVTEDQPIDPNEP